MKKNKLKTAEDLLSQKYGKKGTAKRIRLEAKAITYFHQQNELQTRKQPTMTILKRIAGVLMALLLFASAYGHLFTPEISSGFIPDFLPKKIVHILTSIVEFALGVGVFIPSMRKRALQGILILMILFLPLHLIDLFRESPIIGSKNAAMIRVVFQFLFIFLAWFAGGRLWGQKAQVD